MAYGYAACRGLAEARSAEAGGRRNGTSAHGCVLRESRSLVSSVVFSAFDCLELETDSLSDPKTSLHYVNSDLTLRCDAAVPAYKEATDLAYTLIALWPVAMPLAFALTLFSVRNKLLNAYTEIMRMGA